MAELSLVIQHRLNLGSNKKLILLLFRTGQKNPMANDINILNLPINNISTTQLLKRLGSRGGVVFTPNVDHLMKLQKDPEFYDIYQASTYRVCDSKILIYASKFLGQPIKEKISGSDLFPAFYDYYKNHEKVTIFLMGAAEGVAQRAQENINKKVGRKMIIESYSPPFGFEKDEVECQRIIDRINQSGATVLAIGVGAPKQEKWIAKYRNKLKDIKVFLAIGATIDFEAGEKGRSPKWMSDMGVEWLYRLLSEPKRLWKRYLVEDLPFFWLLLLQKLRLYTPPFSTREEFINWESPRLGQILQKAGLLSVDQVQIIVERQKQEPGKRFGDFAVELGWLEQDTIDFFADYLPQLGLSKQRYPLGYYLYKAKLLNESQIDLILEEQNELKLQFGEIAVMKGLVKQETLDTVLDYLTQQEFINWESPFLGEILRKAGLLSGDQVHAILQRQKQEPGKRFGDFVVELGWLEQDTIDFFADYLPQLEQSQHRHPLGYYLCKAKLLDESQINLILEEQNELKLRFGEIAVMKGWVKQQTLDTVLDYLTQEFEDSIAA